MTLRDRQAAARDLYHCPTCGRRLPPTGDIVLEVGGQRWCPEHAAAGLAVQPELFSS